MVSHPGTGSDSPIGSDQDRGRDKKPKGMCFHCGVKGHWKRNCNKYLSKLKDKNKDKYDLLVSEAFLVEDDLSLWIVN